MKILIVDDNKNNRMILSLLLEDYMDENEGITFEIDEAVDGLEAVRMCDAEEYNIVFMDIMMPNMDGIEATKLIRQKHSKLLIVAVSAVDDTQRQKMILSSGAEDYISKPVNSEIFYKRVENYVHLVKSRATPKEHVQENEKGLNLFSKEIFSRYTRFMLNTEDALSELWEYYLLDMDSKCENLSDVIRAIFSIGEVKIRLNIPGSLFVEESEAFKYFTVVNINELPSNVMELIIKKNEVTCEYKIDDNKITFKLLKAVKETEIIESIKLEPKEESVVEEVISSPLVECTSVELEVFDYLEEDDMSDLEEYAGKLSSLMLIVGSGDVSEDEVLEIYTYIEKIGSILSTYSEVYVISKALSTLASDMSTHTSEFIQNSEALGPMCAAFSKDMSNWITQTFHTGAPSVDFMNDTIAVNCQTIGSMLKMDEVTEDADDFDDIFDF